MYKISIEHPKKEALSTYWPEIKDARAKIGQKLSLFGRHPVDVYPRFLT